MMARLVVELDHRGHRRAVAREVRDRLTGDAERQIGDELRHPGAGSDDHDLGIDVVQRLDPVPGLPVRLRDFEERVSRVVCKNDTTVGLPERYPTLRQLRRRAREARRA